MRWRFTALAELLALTLPGAPLQQAPAHDAAALPALERVMLTAPQAITDFELTDQDGRPTRFSEFRGEPLFVFFGFTHCVDACPTTLLKLRLLKTSAGDELRELRVVMISVDGARDTPAALGAYLAGLPAGFTGLTGAPQRVREIAARFSAVFFEETPRGGSYRIDHSPQVYAIDRRGRLRAELHDASPAVMAELAHALLSEDA